MLTSDETCFSHEICILLNNLLKQTIAAYLFSSFPIRHEIKKRKKRKIQNLTPILHFNHFDVDNSNFTHPSYILAGFFVKMYKNAKFDTQLVELYSNIKNKKWKCSHELNVQFEVTYMNFERLN